MITDITYEASGDTDLITYTNGVTTNFTYDAQRKWLTSVVTTGTSATLQDVTYTRSATGRIDAINGTTTGLKDHWGYIYDDIDQLLTADNLDDNALDQSFTYDDLGNILTRTNGVVTTTYTYPLPGAFAIRPHAQTLTITGGNGANYIYDANGNIRTGDAVLYTWTNDNKLASVLTRATFEYGPDGARIAKTTSIGAAKTIYADADLEISPIGEMIKYPHPDIKKSGTTHNGDPDLHSVASTDTHMLVMTP